MTSSKSHLDHFDLLTFARKIANQAQYEGVISCKITQRRNTHIHLGAIIADSVLQAGVNYRTVVLPRIENIIENYNTYNCTSKVMNIVTKKEVSNFLQWNHHIKIKRFEDVVFFLHKNGVENIKDLKNSLLSPSFCLDMQRINGIGPKTIDYMSCLVGIDSIAVDRHIRNFASRSGVEITDYNYLKNIFSYAADLLKISRRDFDSLVWNFESSQENKQLSLAI